MHLLEVSCALRRIYTSLDAKGLMHNDIKVLEGLIFGSIWSTHPIFSWTESGIHQKTPVY